MLLFIYLFYYFIIIIINVTIYSFTYSFIRLLAYCSPTDIIIIKAVLIPPSSRYFKTVKVDDIETTCTAFHQTIEKLLGEEDELVVVILALPQA